MLDWLTGTGAERAEYSGFAEENKLPEPPATPGPIFAYRAFKNAVLGTPAAEAEEDERELTVPIKPLNTNQSRIRTDITALTKSSEIPMKKNPKDKEPEFDEFEQPTLLPHPEQQQSQPSHPVGSPTKSILLTPGTAVTRRKTVSFGEGVVDNERKRSTPQRSPKKQQILSGTISRQWTAHLSDGTRRNRNKFTQALLEAREKKDPLLEDALFDLSDAKHQHDSQLAASTSDKENAGDDDAILDGEEEEEDVTTNLEQPRSQSGIYWKSEFENYRTRTNQEIRKLLQYRSVAKSYARKKEAEATRLADKLRRYEAKVDELERNVSQLAAGMASNDQDANGEGVVKELSKQTALVLRYKHQVSSLRRTLEKHGVFDDEVESSDPEAATDVTKKLRETEEALEQANAKLRSAADQSPKLKELERQVASSETKAKDLERENLALKRNLARVKEEMSKYEDRRKTKENRLKEREEKLEGRIKIYCAELKEARNKHKQTEEEMRTLFATEKKQLQDTINELRQKLLTQERLSRSNAVFDRQDQDNHKPKPKDRKPSLLNDDIYPLSAGQNEYSDTELPSQKAVGRVFNSHTSSREEFPEIDFDDLITFDQSTPKKNKTRVNIDHNNDGDDYLYNDADDHPIPPSSPPLPDPESSLIISPHVPKHLVRAAPATALAPSPRPSMIYPSLTSRKSGDLSRQASLNNYKKKNATTVDPSTRMPSSPASRELSLAVDANVIPSSDSGGSIAAAKLEGMSAERIAAAKARLKQKQLEGNAKKGDGGVARVGKENVAFEG